MGKALGIKGGVSVERARLEVRAIESFSDLPDRVFRDFVHELELAKLRRLSVRVREDVE
ncbi:hypothetical protein [Poriferisphaera corsica]|uniref:hypothetical protein n=1 Tax=Poriferisphaera corsica TaxID=2528020 RepID=UPI00190E10C1|nr:hypothetical protein [Poriferisphaera corsica]